MILSTPVKAPLTLQKSAPWFDSIVVLFHINVPEALADTGTSLVQGLIDSGETIEISTSFSSFAADTATMERPTVAPATVDCVGSWVADGECSEPCGPDGVVSSSFVVTLVAQNGGADCNAADGDTATEACNTNVQCPIDCDGVWTEWSVCPVPCGGGTSIRSYTILAEAQHGGTCDLADAVETQDCNTDPCPPPPAEPTDCVGGKHALTPLAVVPEIHLNPSIFVQTGASTAPAATPAHQPAK
eukprot:COSAG02_NODE_2_length_75708_cov_87.013953_8_plen_244_part_00